MAKVIIIGGGPAGCEAAHQLASQGTLDVRVDLVGGAGLDDLVIGVGEGDADGADAVIVLRRQAACRDALGQAVALLPLNRLTIPMA